MGFEINKVLNLKVTSIPADNGKSINIEALNDADSRQKLYSLLRVCFDKAGKKKGVLEAVEIKALYNEAGGKIDKHSLNKLLIRFKITIFPQVNETEQKIEELIIELKNRDDHIVRMLAADKLGYIGPAAKEAIPALTAASEDKELVVCEAAINALGKIGIAAVPALRTMLKNTKKYIAFNAARSLGNIGSAAKEAVPALIEALKDPNDAVRMFAAQSLGEISHAKEVVAALIIALNDPSDRVRSYAAVGLENIGPAAKEAVPALIEALKEKDPYLIYLPQKNALVKIGPAAISDLITALTDKNKEVREHAAEALGEISPAAKEAIPALEKLLKDENVFVYIAAQLALNKIRKK